MIRLDGHLPNWSPRHDAHEKDYLDGDVDGALCPFLDRLTAMGLRPVSSCQGGWVFRTSDQMEFQAWTWNTRGRRIRDPNPRWICYPGPEDDWALGTLVPGGGGWWKKRPHLFLATGPGHGGGGVLHGATEMRQYLDDDHVTEAERVCAAFTTLPTCTSRIAADEVDTLVILEGTAPMDDVTAQAWWETITATTEKQYERVAHF